MQLTFNLAFFADTISQNLAPCLFHYIKHAAMFDSFMSINMSAKEEGQCQTHRGIACQFEDSK